MSAFAGLVRPIAPADVGAVAALHVQAFDDDDASALERATKSLEEELARPWAEVWVAVEEGRVVGALVAWLVADEIHVLDVATLPREQRRGVGRALVTALKERGRQKNSRHVYLEVRRSNAAAIALYRDAGFAAVGVRARYYANDEDAVEMALAFDPAGAVVPPVDSVALH